MSTDSVSAHAPDDVTDSLFENLEKLKQEVLSDAPVPGINSDRILQIDDSLASGSSAPLTHVEYAQLRTFLERIEELTHSALVLCVKSQPASQETNDQSLTSEQVQDAQGASSSVVHGMFDGQNMKGPDGALYTVPPNYASKSKLVEGDLMKLSIMPSGAFVYKQIRPVERRRIVGSLEYDADMRAYRVVAEGRPLRVLTASITYYKGIPGDETVVLVPSDREATWGAVEHVIKHGPL